jgi:tetratricopeptide (TPR) repeat protein
LALGHLRFGLTFEQKGMVDEARKSFQQAISLSKGGMAVPDLGHLDAVSGQRTEALDIAEKLKSRPSPPSYGLAIVYVGLGDKDLAFAWLERAYAERSAFDLMTLAVEPRLDPLRDDVRFQNLLRRMNLPQ